jgi:hypothetical protein
LTPTGTTTFADDRPTTEPGRSAAAGGSSAAANLCAGAGLATRTRGCSAAGAAARRTATAAADHSDLAAGASRRHAAGGAAIPARDGETAPVNRTARRHQRGKYPDAEKMMGRGAGPGGEDKSRRGRIPEGT